MRHLAGASLTSDSIRTRRNVFDTNSAEIRLQSSNKCICVALLVYILAIELVAAVPLVAKGDASQAVQGPSWDTTRPKGEVLSANHHLYSVTYSLSERCGALQTSRTLLQFGDAACMAGSKFN